MASCIIAKCGNMKMYQILQYNNAMYDSVIMQRTHDRKGKHISPCPCLLIIICLHIYISVCLL